MPCSSSCRCSALSTRSWMTQLQLLTRYRSDVWKETSGHSLYSYMIDTLSLLLIKSQCEIGPFLHRSWSPLPSMCWSVSLQWRLRITRPTLNCCSGKTWRLSVRWLKATAKTGRCFSVFLKFSQQYFKNRNWSSLPLMHQRGKEASVDWRGGRGVAEAVRGAPSFWRFVLSASFYLFVRHFCALIRSVLYVFSLSVPDIVETLLPLLSNSNRTRRQVVTQLVHMGLVDNAKDLKKPKCVFFYG